MPSSNRDLAVTGMPPGSIGPGLRRVQSRRGPGQQLALVEHRHNRHLVGIVNPAVKSIVGIPDVSITNPRVLL